MVIPNVLRIENDTASSALGAGFPVLFTPFHFPPLHGERSLRFIIPMHTSGRRSVVGFIMSSPNACRISLQPRRSINHTNEHRRGLVRNSLWLFTAAR